MPNPYGLTEWEYEEINRMSEEARMKRMDPLFENHPSVAEQRKQAAEFIAGFQRDQNRNQTECLLNTAMDHIAGTLEQPTNLRAWEHLLIYCPLEILETTYLKRGIWCPRHPDAKLVRIECPDGKIDLRCPDCTEARIDAIKPISPS